MTTAVALDDASLMQHAATGTGLSEVTALVRFFWTGRSVFHLSCTGDRLVTSLYSRQNLDEARFLVSVLSKVPIEPLDSARWRLCSLVDRHGESREIWDRASLESQMSVLLVEALDAAALDWASDYASLARELYAWAEACRTVRKGQRDRLFDHSAAKALFAAGTNAKTLLQRTLLGVFMFATAVSDPGVALAIPTGAGTARAMCESYLHPLLGPGDCTPERAGRAKELGSRVHGVHGAGFRECWHTKESGRGPHRIYVDASSEEGHVSAAVGYIGPKLYND